MRQTALQQLVDLKMGGRLKEYVLQRRAAGLDWRTIAVEVSAETEQPVSYESLRSWFEELDRQLPVSRGA